MARIVMPGMMLYAIPNTTCQLRFQLLMHGRPTSTTGGMNRTGPSQDVLVGLGMACNVISVVSHPLKIQYMGMRTVSTTIMYR